MNYRAIFNILGSVLLIEAGLLMIPIIVAGIYQESAGIYFLITGAICAALGLILKLVTKRNHNFYAKEGFFMVALSWIVISIFGALPFFLSGYIPSYIDALFETISGFTTTGATILTDVEVLPKCLLFWRSLTHWIGGMGILVFIVAILPSAGGDNMHLMRVESPGPSVDKLVPKAKHTAFILYGIYVLLSLMMFISVILGGMSVFDALTTTFATAGTGGFGNYNSSMADYSATLQWIIGVFMVMFGINFNMYFLILAGKLKEGFKITEIRRYLEIIGVATLLIVLCTHNMFDSLGDAIRNVFFSVASVITTTGFATTDFNLWPMFAKAIIVVLMLIGACAGSTGGGIKVSRVILAVRMIKEQIRAFIHPHVARSTKLDGNVVSKDVRLSLSAFFMLYLILMFGSFIIVSIDNFDFETSFTSVATCISNVGPGLSKVGPSGNFAGFSILSKFVLMFDMLAGRLELFPILMLFSLRTWRRR